MEGPDNRADPSPKSPVPYLEVRDRELPVLSGLVLFPAAIHLRQIIAALTFLARACGLNDKDGHKLEAETHGGSHEAYECSTGSASDGGRDDASVGSNCGSTC